MQAVTEAFPLNWPIGRERTSKYSRKSSNFNTTPGRARDQLLHELKLLGASNVVISSNVATYRRGGQDIPYADQSGASEDPGVAVYYVWRSEQYCLACDKWKTVMDNMQALMKTVDAIRGIERWGTGEMMRAAFAGFKALPQQANKKPWHVVLGVRPTASHQEIKEAYRKRSLETHPDKGGATEQFTEVYGAYQEGLNQNN